MKAWGEIGDNYIESVCLKQQLWLGEEYPFKTSFKGDTKPNWYQSV